MAGSEVSPSSVRMWVTKPIRVSMVLENGFMEFGVISSCNHFKNRRMSTVGKRSRCGISVLCVLLWKVFLIAVFLSGRVIGCRSGHFYKFGVPSSCF